MTDLAKILDALTEKQVGFKVLQQSLDTTTNEGRLLLHIMGAFAEFETAIRKERQAEGIVKAKAAGKYRGRKASIDPEVIAAMKQDGLGASAIARRLGIGRASVYRLIPSAKS